MASFAVLVNPFHFQRKGYELPFETSRRIYERALERVENAPLIIYHSLPIESLLQEEQDLLSDIGRTRECFLYPFLGEEQQAEHACKDWMRRTSRREEKDLYIFGEPLIILPYVALDLQKRWETKRVPIVIIPGCQRDPEVDITTLVRNITSIHPEKIDLILENFGNP